MAKKGRKRIAHNAVPVEWDGMSFSSFKELDEYHGLTHGYARMCWKKSYPLRGREVIAHHKNKKVFKRWVDNDLIDYAHLVLKEARDTGVQYIKKDRLRELIIDLEVEV